MVKFFIVGAGGFLGAVSRYAVSGFFSRLFEKFGIPCGTLAVNVTGCLLIGLLGGLVENRQLLTPETRLFLLIGFIGSFTTFSTYGYEIFTLAREGLLILSFITLMSHLVFGLGSVYVGFYLSKLF